MTDRLTDEPLTLAVYAILDEAGDQAANYLGALTEFQRAEELGVEGVWVRQFHLSRGSRGGLPSPFVFLAWLAARTSTLRLGTGIVTLPLETPTELFYRSYDHRTDALEQFTSEIAPSLGWHAPAESTTITAGAPS